MLINRLIQPKIEKKMFKGKVIVIYGARQVGKTTLIKQIQAKNSEISAYFNCDESDVREAFSNTSSTAIKHFLGNKKLIFLDEAQRVENIGLTLKLIVDNFPEIQIIATGSSSFDLSNKIIEPLTGRKYEFFLYPLAMKELSQIYSSLELKRLLEQRIVFGMYPAVISSGQEAAEILKNLARSYSYKDVLNYQDIRNPEVLEKLLQALALQIGNEVSYNELGRLVGINRLTVQSYIKILEQAFIIFKLRPLSRNPRKELGKLHKIYFVDTGIRNALINNLNPLNLRNDVGSLWENFWISERIKNNSFAGRDINTFFWRTYSHQEVDFVEEENAKIFGFECKWNNLATPSVPGEWSKLYGKNSFNLIKPDVFIDSLY
ncbi:MAG: ATP-binding protein [Candidatus Uhrbacteria bacterium]